MGRLFGTDGARGVANTELTCELAMNIGRAAAVVLTKHTIERPKLIIGRDTRISSKMLESALVAGICSVGADAEILGVIPTPAIPFLVSAYEADAGIMISASHNPVEFNGIKLFNAQGFKLSDEIEEEIEELILDHPENMTLKEGTELGRIWQRRSAAHDYVQHLVSTIEGDLSGLKIAVDCANGSASATAGLLFKELHADVIIMNAEPNGWNINDKCGSTHIDKFAYFVVDNACDIGVSFDGDADRCLAVNENGEIIDGDQMIAIFAKDLKEHKKLAHDTAVVTVMSNMGFFAFAKKHTIHTVTTQVGDRYVLEEMLNKGYNLGGEQSGHIIMRDHATTGDGQLSAIKLIDIIKRTGKRASEIGRIMEIFPQVLVNVQVSDAGKQRLDTDTEVQEIIQKHTQALGEEGRILVRASGTEPLIRVMLEGKDTKTIKQYANEIAGVIKERLS